MIRMTEIALAVLSALVALNGLRAGSIDEIVLGLVCAAGAIFCALAFPR